MIAKKKRKNGHHRADVYQYPGAGKSARQRVNGQLRRKRAEKHRPTGRRFRIRVGQPVVQQGKRRFDAERDKNQLRTGRRQSQPQVVHVTGQQRVKRFRESQRTGVPEMQQDAR